MTALDAVIPDAVTSCRDGSPVSFVVPQPTQIEISAMTVFSMMIRQSKGRAVYILADRLTVVCSKRCLESTSVARLHYGGNSDLVRIESTNADTFIACVRTV